MKIKQLNSQIYELTKRCHCCGELVKFTVPVEEMDNYILNDVCIQDALKSVSSENREMLISGICPKCWDKMFKGVI